MASTVTVWAHAVLPPPLREGVVHWQGYGAGVDVISLPRYVETHGERLRDKYIAFIHDLGEAQLGGKTLVEHLDFGGGFSFWWMNQIAEKSPFKSSRIYDCLRVLALEEVLRAGRPLQLTLVSADKTLSHAIARLCQNLGIEYLWERPPCSRPPLTLRSIYDRLPNGLKALLSLRHLVNRWSLRRLKLPPWFGGANSVFVCSYFFNLDPVLSSKGRFHSRQWEGLPQHLQDSGLHTNWVHHLLNGFGSPVVKTAGEWVSNFNADAKNQGAHSILDTFLSLRVVYRALKNWRRLFLTAVQLKEIERAFQPRESAAWLWPLLRQDWNLSMRGPAALQNCLWVELFDVALRDMPRQEVGLYLWENQGWEHALLHAWRKHGHGQIIGVPHATVVFWHLNNFDDPRTICASKKNAKLCPDKLAINGPMAWRAFTQTGYPVELLVPVEAMRFQYLLPFAAAVHGQNCKAAGKTTNASAGKPLRVLVLGDFTQKQTMKMLKCIEMALKITDIEVLVTLKLHPACVFEKKIIDAVAFNVADKPLSELMHEFDLAFASNSTSAGLDALLAGLNVAIFLDEDDLNQSPLRGLEDVKFIDGPEALVNAFRGFRRIDTPPVDQYFWLASQFPKWDMLLDNARKYGVIP